MPKPNMSTSEQTMATSVRLPLELVNKIKALYPKTAFSTIVRDLLEKNVVELERNYISEKLLEGLTVNSTLYQDTENEEYEGYYVLVIPERELTLIKDEYNGKLEHYKPFSSEIWGAAKKGYSFSEITIDVLYAYAARVNKTKLTPYYTYILARGDLNAYLGKLNPVTVEEFKRTKAWWNFCKVTEYWALNGSTIETAIKAVEQIAQNVKQFIS